MSSFDKFYGEQDNHHGGSLWWVDNAQLPIRGIAQDPMLRPDEIRKLPMICDRFHHTFNLSDPKDGEWYDWVMSRIRIGWFTQDYVQREWDAATKSMTVYLEWSQLYKSMSTSALREISRLKFTVGTVRE